jgi:hypothetical protein
MNEPASEFLRESGLDMSEGGAGEPKDRGVKGLDIVAWEGRRWWDGEVFLLISFEHLEDGETEEAKPSSDGLDCCKFFFQFRLAVRTFSS